MRRLILLGLFIAMVLPAYAGKHLTVAQLEQTLSCQGRSKSRPLGRNKREPVRWTVRRSFSGEKGLWSVAGEALLPRSAFGGGRFSFLRMGFVCGGFA